MAVEALIGRHRESAVLRDLVERALAGSGGAVLVRGEAGIGKSALVAGAAAQAHQRSARVLTGTCWQGAGTPGYWPWIQILRTLANDVGRSAWESLRAQVPALEPLAADWAGPSASSVPLSASADEAAAFALHDAVATVLVQAARSTALVIVLEDLQWADSGSLRLAEMLVQRVALAPVAVMATERDEGDPRTRARIASCLARAVTVQLTGLDAHGVAELVARTTGEQPEPELAESIAARTGGNPFFVQQTAALWRVGGSGMSIPPGVSEALARRLARLPTRVHELLVVGALWGPWFDVEIVAATAGLSPEAAAELMTVARDAGLLTEVTDSPGPAARFVHDLLRESLIAGLPQDQARALHARAVLGVLATPTLAARVLPAQLAEHAYRAGPALPAERAVPILLAAGRSDAARLAAEEACVHYERAVRLMQDAATPDVGELEEAALALGAQQGRAGHLDRARATFEAVAGRARARRDTSTLARAALGLHELGHDMTAGPTGPMDDVLDAVLADPLLRRSALAARVMAAASRDRAHTIGAERARGEKRSEQALLIARAADDPAAIGLCLVARHDAIWAPASVRERLSLATEMVEIGQRNQDRQLHLLGMHLRVAALLELGDPRALAEHAAARALTDRLPLPRERYAALSRQVAIDTLQGRFEPARRTMDAARDLGEMIGEPNREGLWADQLWQWCRLTGADAELDAVIADLRADGDQHVAVLEASVALDRGTPDVALGLLDELRALGAAWPRWAALTWLSQQAQIAAASGDRALCQQVRADMEPWIDHWVVLGGAVLVDGPLRLWAARVDAALEEWDAAVVGFTAAVEAARRMAAEPWRVLAQLDLAAALIGRGRGEDLSKAAALLGHAAEDARRLGMRRALASAYDLRARLRPARPVEDVADRTELNMLRLEGSVWTIRYQGRITHQPDAKGLRDLHTLLRNPRVEIPAADLADPSGDRGRRASDGMGSDPVLDETAKQAFRQRLAQLDEAIDDAVLGGDDDRAAGLDRERHALVDELARATGLGGRSRRLGDGSERARKAVTGRIRDAIRRIGDADPELAAHLSESISTGTACSYRPHPPVTWEQ